MKSLHSFSRSESEIETARDREREVKMKKKFSRILEKRESRWSLLRDIASQSYVNGGVAE